jgi:flap endonuclease-1
MGVKNITKLFSRHCKDANCKVPITDLAGKRVAIDASLWMRANMQTARKIVANRTDVLNHNRQNEDMIDNKKYNFFQSYNPAEITREWMLLAFKFVLKWGKCNVTPIWVFDGNPPPEKTSELSRRKSKDEGILAKIEALYTQLQTDHSLVEDYKKEFKNYTRINEGDFAIFKTIMRGLGVPCIQGNCEAEKLCSMLYRDGKVAAVYSKDSDNLAFKCGLLITGFGKDGASKVPTMDCVKLDKILEGLKLTHAEFIDLCIMCGCDYNKNMPGYASINSYKLLLQHRSIDNLPRHLNVEILNHHKSRELFAYVNHAELIVYDTENFGDSNTDFKNSDNVKSCMFNFNVNSLINARLYLDMVGLGSFIAEIRHVYHNLSEAEDSVPLDDKPSVPTKKRLTLNIIS